MSDRAERLRERRNQAGSATRTQDRSESSEDSKPSETSETSETSEQAQTSESSESEEMDEPEQTDKSAQTSESTDADVTDESSVKDECVGTYMYLPESQKDALDLAFKKANLSVEEATGEELEKNRHFYPLVVQAGLDSLDGLDGGEIQARLDDLNV